MAIRIEHTKLDGVLIIEPEIRRDERGFFLESYNKRLFHEHGITYDFVQDNHSRSSAKVIRGLHYQDMRAPQVKLVRCTIGWLFDVVVDLRAGAPTFGQWVGIELTAENGKQLLVPVGFGHGFAVLSDVAELQYKVSDYYSPQADGGVRWDDPDIGVEWPFSDPILSKKDETAMTLRQYLEAPRFVYAEMRSQR